MSDRSTTPSTRCANCGGTGWTLCEDGSKSETRCPVGCPLQNPSEVRTISVMLDRVRAGEPLDEVMADYGWSRLAGKLAESYLERNILRAALERAEAQACMYQAKSLDDGRSLVCLGIVQEQDRTRSAEAKLAKAREALEAVVYEYSQAQAGGVHKLGDAVFAASSTLAAIREVGP